MLLSGLPLCRTFRFDNTIETKIAPLPHLHNKHCDVVQPIEFLFCGNVLTLRSYEYALKVSQPR